MIVTQEIEMTASCEYSDFILPANSWPEFQALEVPAPCSNPFLQIWGRPGSKPLYNTLDDVTMYGRFAAKMTEVTGDRRYADYWKFAIEDRAEVYLQRLLDASATPTGHNLLRADPRHHPLLHRHGPDERLLGHTGGDRPGRELHRPPRRPGGDTLSAERHRQHEPAGASPQLRHPPGAAA